MNFSSFSTEALKHELRLQQARPASNPRRLFNTSNTNGAHEKSSNGGDEDLLLVRERCTSKKRRRSSSCEILNSEDKLEPSRCSPIAMTYQARGFPRTKYFKKRDTAELRRKHSCRIGEGLTEAKEDDLLMLMEGQWTSACPGAKCRPIDLERTRTYKPPKSVPRSFFDVRESSKRSSKLISDSAIARQIQKEEAHAQEARLREAATRTRDCAVCGDTKLVLELPSLASCAHDADICADCYTAWLGSQLADNGWQEVKCPGQSCKVSLTYEEIKAYASKKVFERYDAIQARNVLSADPNFRWCRAEGCTSGQIHDAEELGNVFNCVECHEQFCTVHEGASHDKETCEEFDYRTSGQKDRDERKQEEEASEEALKILTKKCPKEGCGSPIQKNGGCNHITCWKCRHHFCYVCLQSNYQGCGHLHMNI